MREEEMRVIPSNYPTKSPSPLTNYLYSPHLLMDFVSPSYILDCMELYHLLNRGTDKRTIFLDDRDRLRFIHNLYEFNDTAPAGNAYRSFQMMDLRSPSFETLTPREKIVDLHGWCLMKNHYHLLVSERAPGGLTAFIRKLNIGYAKYFNERYERSGTLFQGRTKKVLVSRNAHFLYILHYIHLNPLDFLKDAKQWREKRVRGAARALEHLETYRWSSYLDYAGTKNFPSILTTELFRDVCKDFKKETSEYLQNIDLDTIKTLTLE